MEKTLWFVCFDILIILLHACGDENLSINAVWNDNVQTARKAFYFLLIFVLLPKSIRNSIGFTLTCSMNNRGAIFNAIDQSSPCAYTSFSQIIIHFTGSDVTLPSHGIKVLTCNTYCICLFVMESLTSTRCYLETLSTYSAWEWKLLLTIWSAMWIYATATVLKFNESLCSWSRWLPGQFK